MLIVWATVYAPNPTQVGHSAPESCVPGIVSEERYKVLLLHCIQLVGPHPALAYDIEGLRKAINIKTSKTLFMINSTVGF